MPHLELLYQGSQKRLYRPEGINDRYWLEFIETGDPSISNQQLKARCQSVVSSFLFEKLADPATWTHIALSPVLQPIRPDWLDRRWNHLNFVHVLSEHGMPTHFKGLVDTGGNSLSRHQVATLNEPTYMEVLAAESGSPKSHLLNGQPVFYYPYKNYEERCRIIPLEVYFHFGMPQDSFLRQRMDKEPSYFKRLGLDKKPIPLSLFERPVLEFSAHYEESRRVLNLQEALLTSGLTAGRFEELIETSYSIALALHVICAERDLILWAGKLEYAINKEGLISIDSLGPADLLLGYGNMILPGHSLAQIHPIGTTDSDLGATSSAVIANQLADETLFTDLPDLKKLIGQLRAIQTQPIN